VPESTDCLKAVLSFLAILNPFALCLYLMPVMEDLDKKTFVRVIGRAAGISALVFILFALGGEPLLRNVLNIRPNALRVFGGVIFFVWGYAYVTKGYRAVVAFRGDLEDLPSEIALPFMIGAGTITQAILIGKQHPGYTSIPILLLGMAFALSVVILFKAIRDRLRVSHGRIFDRYVNTLSRLNGLVIGALSAEMIIVGVRSIWTT